MKNLILFFFIVFIAHFNNAQTDPINVIVFGAHPDDCDIDTGGTAILLAKMGHKVKFVSLTNGDAGHYAKGGGALAKIRIAEAKEVQAEEDEAEEDDAEEVIEVDEAEEVDAEEVDEAEAEVDEVVEADEIEEIPETEEIEAAEDSDADSMIEPADQSIADPEVPEVVEQPADLVSELRPATEANGSESKNTPWWAKKRKSEGAIPPPPPPPSGAVSVVDSVPSAPASPGDAPLSGVAEAARAAAQEMNSPEVVTPDSEDALARLVREAMQKAVEGARGTES